MVLALAFVVPTICGQIFTPSQPLFTPNSRAIQLVILSVVLQLGAGQIADLAHLLMSASFAGGTAALAWIVWTSGHNRISTTLAALGGLANLIPIARYGAMPVRMASRESFSSVALSEPSLISAKHAEASMAIEIQNPVSLLIDWIPVPALHAVISVGDLLLVAALVWLGVAKGVAARGFQPNP